MKKLFLACVIIFPMLASAQYRYQTYSVGIATNAWIGTNSFTNFNTFFAVSGGTKVDLQVAIKQTHEGTNAIPATDTNGIDTGWRFSFDGTRSTNSFVFTVYGNAMTNVEAWNIMTTNNDYAYLEFVGMTNRNIMSRITNISVRIGQNIGL